MWRPKISVLLPIYNAERTLTAAVSSILRQSFEDFELIAIDDGSTDATGRILRSFRDPRIRIIDRGCNQGLVAALNDGVEDAKADLIARQDADDVSMPDRFALQRGILADEPETGAVGAALQLVYHGKRCGRWLYPVSATAARWQALFKTPVAHSVVMFRRRCVLELGGYSAAYKYAEDYDLWSRLLKVAGIKSVSVPLLNYSLDPSGVSREKSAEQQAVQCIIAARNMRELLGRDVPTNIVQMLAIGLDERQPTKDLSAVLEAAEMCSTLFRAFLEQESHRDDIRTVSADCGDRLLRLVRMLPRRVRPRAIRKVRALTPGGAFGAMAIVRAMARP